MTASRTMLAGLPDLIGRHLLVEYCVRHELGHVAAVERADDALSERSADSMKGNLNPI